MGGINYRLKALVVQGGKGVLNDIFNEKKKEGTNCLNLRQKY